MTEDAKGEPVAEARPSQPGLDAQRALQDAITDELVELDLEDRVEKVDAFIAG